MNVCFDDHAGRSVSSWMTTATLPAYDALTEDAEADVCIVGAGVAGLTTALLLGREGRKVIVLDDGPIASGETERTTAHLTIAQSTRYADFLRLHGEVGARLIAESHAEAIDDIESFISEERIDCDFERVDGYLFVPEGESVDVLMKEREALHCIGFSEVEPVSQLPVATIECGPALKFPRQAQFHPLKYIAALARAFVREGGRIFSHTHVTKVEGGASARVSTSEGHVVRARHIVVATNSPVNDLLTMHTKQAQYRTYAIAAEIAAGSVSPMLLWDTADPYHYVRIQRGQGTKPAEPTSHDDWLIIGGEDHKTGQADDAEARYARLEAWARQCFPMMSQVTHRWSGQVVEPMDGIAFIGRNPMDHDNVFIATGFSGNGITHGTIAGRLITDLIARRQNAWAALYDPSRRTLRAAGKFADENLNVAAQYADWLTHGDVSDETLIPPGGGAVIRRRFHKVAVYRDDLGTLHECSATCPHLGGIVHWNHAEKTWDCPCHGSRFDCFGKVMCGPAIGDLEKVEVPESMVVSV